MLFIPELAPWLPRERYTASVSFILPTLLEERRATHGPFAVRVDVSLFLSGTEAPLRGVFSIPDAQGNAHYSFLLSDILPTASLPASAEGYVVLHTHLDAKQALPPFLKMVGFWVAYATPQTYAVIPSGVQFASPRMDYSSTPRARLMDYFGLVQVNEQMDTHLLFINPFAAASDAEVVCTAEDGTHLTARTTIPAFGSGRIALSRVCAEAGRTLFRGQVVIRTSHRLASYVFFLDRISNLYYSADHTIPWVNRQIRG